MYNSFIKLQRLTMEYDESYVPKFRLREENVCLSLINMVSFEPKLMGFYHNNPELLDNKIWGSVNDISDIYTDFRHMIDMDKFMMVKVDDTEHYINMENLFRCSYAPYYGYELQFKDGKYCGIETNKRIDELDNLTQHSINNHDNVV